MSSTTSLALASVSLREQVLALTQEAVAAWCIRWGVRVEAAVTAQATDIDSDETGTWLVCGSPGSAALHWPDGIEECLRNALFGVDGDPRAALAGEGATHVAQALQRVLQASWNTGGAWQPMGEPLRLSRWDAPVRMLITLPGLGKLRAVVSGTRCGLVSASAARRERLARVDRTAFDHLAARMRLVVGRAEIPVPDAASLQVGDVIVLGARIDEPMQLQLPGDTASLTACLGQVDGRRAAQVFPSSKS